MRSANPALKSETFNIAADGQDVMTLQGAVNKTSALLLLVVLSATISWTNPNSTAPLLIVGAIAGFIIAIITAFNAKWSPVTAPMYAACEGFFLGGISLIFERMYPGIVFNAVFLTFGILFSLLIAYKSGLIKPTENFKLGVAAATGGICLVYVFSMIMGMFGMSVPFLHSGGPIGIGISLFIVVIASLNLVLDFDFIEEGAERGAPKYMEWYAAFGLLVTLVWLYLEILHLLAKTRD